MKKLLAIIVLITIVAAGCYQRAVPAPVATSSSVKPVGSIVKLPNMFLGTTKSNYDRLVKLSTARDETGIKQMIMAREAFVVEAGTEAKILDNGILVMEVRIEDGSNAGRSGWIARELVE